MTSLQHIAPTYGDSMFSTTRDTVVGESVGQRPSFVRAHRAEGTQRSVAQPEYRDLFAGDGERAPFTDGNVVDGANGDLGHRIGT